MVLNLPVKGGGSCWPSVHSGVGVGYKKILLRGLIFDLRWLVSGDFEKQSCLNDYATNVDYKPTETDSHYTEADSHSTEGQHDPPPLTGRFNTI